MFGQGERAWTGRGRRSGSRGLGACRHESRARGAPVYLRRRLQWSVTPTATVTVKYLL